LNWKERHEKQSSSGIIVSTGFGSTGWFQSVLAGAMGITKTNKHKLSSGFGWDEKRLQFSVREPFPSQTTGTDLVFGVITRKSPLRIESQMPENGIVFSDGIEADYLTFNSGTVVSIRVADIQGRLIC